MAFAAWQPATHCTGAAAPGARALMAVILARHPKARNLGIYNCRKVRGASSTSCHAEGRALDPGFPTQNGRGSPAGHALLRELLDANPARLGIQTIIYDRVIYSAKSPGGRRYNGVNPHYDHLHIELTRSAAARLTKATILAILDGHAPPQTNTKPPARKLGSRTLRRGSAGEDVALLQRFFGFDGDRVDGTFGDRTGRAVQDYQKMRGLTVDGIAGPRTLAPIVKALGL